MASVIWLVDRSRYETGLGYCPRARFLEYHFGPSGYGIRAKAASMPQMRGIYIHDGCAYLFQYLKLREALPLEATIRWAVGLSTTAYEKVVDARGLRQLDAGQTVDTIIQEQRSILTGMIWSLALEFLPWFHAEFRVVSVEEEEVGVLGCTCGLGDLIGTVADHEARDCQGIGWMSRADVIAERRTTGTLVYVELKTTGQTGEMFETQWETKIQFAAGILGAEARLGRPIDESMVVALIVGRRAASWDSESGSTSGPRIQQSVFCYGYKRSAPAPGMVEEWAPSWKYVDEQGRNRTLGKAFSKAPVWEMDSRLTGGVDPAEYWVRWLDSRVRGQQIQIIGPLSRQVAVLNGFKAQVVSHEREWQGKVWTLYETALNLAHEGRVTFSHPEYQAALDENVPCSWQCRRYGLTHECSFADLCHKREGWEDPLGSGKYQLRRPHHTPEVQQAIDRGIELPADEGEETE